MEEGIENRVAGRQLCAAVLREGAKQLGLRLLLDDHMSSTVTSVFLPEGIDLDAFLTEMDRRGYTLYKGKGKYEREGMFQIANMGEIYEQDCRTFLLVLEDCLKSFGA